MRDLQNLISVVSGRQFTRALPDAPGRFESSGPAINGSYDLTDEKSPGETLVLSCRWTSEVRWILPDNTVRFFEIQANLRSTCG